MSGTCTGYQDTSPPAPEGCLVVNSSQNSHQRCFPQKFCWFSLQLIYKGLGHRMAPIDYPSFPTPHRFAIQTFNPNQHRIKQCTNTSTSPAPASLSTRFLSSRPRRKGEANSFHQSSFFLSQILHSYEKLSKAHSCP